MKNLNRIFESILTEDEETKWFLRPPEQVLEYIETVEFEKKNELISSIRYCDCGCKSDMERAATGFYNLFMRYMENAKKIRSSSGDLKFFV